MPVELTDCAVLSLSDELREAQSLARRELGADGRPSKAAVSAFVAEVLGGAPGENGSGSFRVAGW